MYTNGRYSFTEENWTYLNGDINLSASASVTIDCEMPDDKCYADKTAWAYGGDYANENWDYVNNWPSP